MEREERECLGASPCWRGSPFGRSCAPRRCCFACRRQQQTDRRSPTILPAALTVGWQWEGVAGCLSSTLDSEEANGWSDDVDGLSLLRHSSFAVRLPVALFRSRKSTICGRLSCTAACKGVIPSLTRAALTLALAFSKSSAASPARQATAAWSGVPPSSFSGPDMSLGSSGLAFASSRAFTIGALGRL